MEARAHDEAVAAISHAPLVLAAALVEATTAAGNWPSAQALAAGGWASMTRLAAGDPTMGAGILATNGPATAVRLRAIRDGLDGWIRLLEATAATADGEAIRTRLAAARERIRE
jgi:prephenate dehydrogenase